MKKKKTGEEFVKVIPLGGLEQIGMNITAFETEDSIIVVDCGLSFPADDMLGIDLVIPDVTYLKDNIDNYYFLYINYNEYKYKDYISLVFNISYFTGGAHPNYEIKTINYNIKNNNFITITNLINKDKNILNKLSTYSRKYFNNNSLFK